MCNFPSHLVFKLGTAIRVAGLLALLLPAVVGAGEPISISDEQIAEVDLSAANDTAQPNADPTVQPPAADPLAELQQLLGTPVEVPAFQQEVTSVSRQESTVGKSPAAVFVITNEMIRRSGVTTVAEALRMAPGMNVAKIDEANWAISARGFQDRFANKMLVQIDGRTVYTPIFAGVYWQLQDMLLQDIDRIEVIRGPGATVWGANAVNGIINVITKTSQETQGSLAFAGGGNMERGIAGARYGGQIGENATYRVWGKWRDHAHGYNASDTSVEDWRAGRGGFRIDWQPTSADTVTVQGDTYVDKEGLFENKPVFPPLAPFSPLNPTPLPAFSFPGTEDRRFTGSNVLGRWTHQINDESNWQFQAYYDNFGLDQTLITADINTLDLDLTHQFRFATNHQVIYGLGYRVQDAVIGQSTYVPFGLPASYNGFQLTPLPYHLNLDQFSLFVQDELTLIEDQAFLTAGCKVENNPFVGWIAQPTARALWSPTNRQAWWASVSRALRTPSFQERVNQITNTRTATTFSTRLPNPNFFSEDVMAYELGYRAQPNDFFSWDMALFFNDYRNLRVATPVGSAPPFFFNNFQNRMNGETDGVELSGTVQMSDVWKVYGTYSFLQMQLHADPSLPAATIASAEGAEFQSPQNQFYVRSSHDLGCAWELDLIGRYVDSLSHFAAAPNDTPVPSYMEMDVRLGYRPNNHWEFAVVGQNLLDNHHFEFGTNPIVGGRPAIEVRRGMYATATATW
jgi:iron complex outermembrane receptor protein